MSRQVVYKCWECGDEHDKDNMAPFCAACYGLQDFEISKLRNALKDILAHAEPMQHETGAIARGFLQVVVAKAKEALK